MLRVSLLAFSLLVVLASTAHAQNVRRIRWMAIETPCGGSSQIMTAEVVGPTTPDEYIEVTTGNDHVIPLAPGALERVVAVEAATGAIGASGLTVKLEVYGADGALAYAGSAWVAAGKTSASFAEPKAPGFDVGVLTLRESYDGGVFGLEIGLRGEGASAVSKVVVATTNPQKEGAPLTTTSTLAGDAIRSQRRFAAPVHFDGDAAGSDYKVHLKLLAPRPGKKPEVLARSRVVLSIASVPQPLPCGGGLALQSMPPTNDHEAPECCDHIDLDLDVDP